MPKTVIVGAESRLDAVHFPEQETPARHTFINAIPRSACSLCGQEGQSLYQGMVDWLFGVPGMWGMRQCRPCGLAWLDPQPVAEDIIKLYSRYYTHCSLPVTRLARLRSAILQCQLAKLGYAVDPAKDILPRLLFHIPSVARTAALEVFALPACEIGELLDVGCGNGEFIARMHSLGWTVAGVEPDSQAVAHVRSRGLEVFSGMISDVPSSERYDVITLSHVIEHVIDPLELLRECRNRLRPGTGRLMITSPNLGGLGHWWFKGYWRGLEVPRHLNVFSPAALRECVERAGLAVQSLRTESRLAHMIYTPSACARAGGRDVGECRDFKTGIKLAAYLFRALEDLTMLLRQELGEEVFCVCTAPAAS